MTYKIGEIPARLTDEVRGTILHYARQDLSINNAARHAKILEETLQKWMALGKDDLLNERDTFLSKFYGDVRKNQSEYITDALLLIKCGTKNWQGLAWILKQCFAEEFGDEAPAYKDLLALCNTLMQQFKDAQKPSHGVVING